MKTFKPDSENVKRVKYDPEEKHLEVEFHSGSTYLFENISRQRYDAFKNADSVGAYAAKKLKNGEKIK